MTDLVVTATDSQGNKTTTTVSFQQGSPQRVNNCSVWAMMWPNSPKTDMAALPLSFDEVRLAFALNDGRLPSPGYGPYGSMDNLRKQLWGFLDKRPGRFVSISVGGGGYTITIPNVNDYAKNIFVLPDSPNFASIELMLSTKERPFRFGGLNWDWESPDFAPNATKAIEVSRKMKALRGKDFFVSWSPNGSYKDAYRNALKGAPDVVDEISQQFYDSPVSYDAALTEVRKYVALFGASKVGVGMMVGPEAIYWDLAECTNYMTRLRAETGVRITNLWEGSRPGTAAWGDAMKAITS